MNSFEIIEKVPTPKEYMDLRKAANMTPRELEGAKKGLGNELFSVVLIDKKKKKNHWNGKSDWRWRHCFPNL